MKPNPEKETDDALAGVLPALLRAGQRARRLAIQTGTPLVIGKDGKVEKQWLNDKAEAGRGDDFENYLAAVPDVPPPENDRLD